MGYGQYGGIAYRNGARVDDRSDAMIKPDMGNLGIPGCIPDPSTAGMSASDFAAIRKSCVRAHVVLGDGPVLVSLNKTSWFDISVLRDGAFHALTDQELAAAAVDLPEDLLEKDDDGEPVAPRALDRFRLGDMDGHEGVVRFGVDGHVVEYRMMRVRGYAQHARLTQPDGTVWSGFSGSEIGYGFEDEDDMTGPHIQRHATAFDA